jgi:radical SAM protein with 4Fe4S-binding SPASM domain
MPGTFSEKINILSHLSFYKVWNGLILLLSYTISQKIKKPLHWGKPISIAIEPTTSCNLRCPECPSGKREFSRPTGMLQPEFFQKTIDDISPHLLYLTFYFQGEPYLNRNFLDMVSYASAKKIYTSTSTNAHYLDDETARKTVESGLDRLIVSIDGITQEVYESYRVGGKVDKVIEGTKNIIKWKKQLKSKTPYVLFQFLVVKPNEHQLEDVKTLAKELGVDEVAFKTAQVYDYKNGNELIPENQKYSRYRQKSDGTFEIKNKLLNQCWKMWNSCVITWDGLVVPCCFDKDAKHQLGDLKLSSLSSIWNNTKYRSFRASILKSRKEIDICSNCSEGTKVWEE